MMPEPKQSKQNETEMEARKKRVNLARKVIAQYKEAADEEIVIKPPKTTNAARINRKQRKRTMQK